VESDIGAFAPVTKAASQVALGAELRTVGVEHRAPFASKGGADALSELARKLVGAGRLGEKHRCLEGVANGVGHTGDEMPQILHFDAGKLRKGGNEVVRRVTSRKLDSELVYYSSSVTLEDVDTDEIGTDLPDLGCDLAERPRAI
jgi:hypothetical protein